ncbi:MAG: four helix bundle protein [Planctomycetes bacterium]|nr:four helix bundle protein [Planctomycetota bacterium]
MTPEELQNRATKFGIRVLKLVDALPKRRSADVVARQLARSATSIAANYRAARRSRSKKEFRAKLCVVVEEADESAHWLSVIEEVGMIKAERIADLTREATELLKIFSRMRKTSFGD